LHPAICYRVDLARWRIEIGPEIPTRNDGSSRSTEEITRDINRAYEAAIRHDPANWFWVHNRWKLTNAAAESRRTQT
jgi:KDO2-lipid IV(A) lauroyltransferase